MNTPAFPTQRGTALVVSLAMIVLIAFVLVAFFVRSTSTLGIEKASTSGREALLLAQSATNLVVSDLQAEMRTFSTVSGGSYFPTARTYMVPTRSLLPTVDENALEFTNLVKQSGRPMFLGAPTINVSGGTATDSPGTDGRRISRSRWDAPVLLGADLPAAPNWIYINRDGTLSSTASAAAIGRFAYNVYEIGGLLDINAAGYAATASGMEPQRAATKGGAIWADLRSIPGIEPSAFSSDVSWPPQWRIDRDWQQIGTLDTDVILPWYHASGWMQPYITSGGSEADRMFASRQDLIRFAKTNPGTFLENASGMPYALQYLTTFSRDVNQPTHEPRPDRPKIQYSSTGGGSDAMGQDDQVNPGARSATGEALIKRRFALEHLKLLETSNADPSEIYRRFGLTRSGNTWVYNHGSAGQILNLEQITGRNPDFFETLKAAIHAGSLAVQHGTSLGVTPENFYRPSLGYDDSSLNYQIIQIGANIIDQFDEDSYPTQIEFDGVSFAGVENLPYIDAVASVSLPEKVISGVTPPTHTLGHYIGVGDWADGANVNVLQAVSLLMPRLWAPHAGNPGDQSKVPTNFRIRAETSAAGIDHYVQSRHQGIPTPPTTDPWRNQTAQAGGNSVGSAYRSNYSNLGGENYGPGAPANPATGLHDAELSFSLPANWQVNPANHFLDPQILSHVYSGSGFLSISGTPDRTEFSTVSPWIQNGFGNTTSASALTAPYNVYGFPLGRSWMGPYVRPPDSSSSRGLLCSVAEIWGGPIKLILECETDSGWVAYDTAYYLPEDSHPDCYYALTDVSNANNDADRGNFATAIDGQSMPTMFKFDPRSKRWGGIVANAGFLGRGSKAQERLLWQHQTMPARSTLRPSSSAAPALNTHPQGIHYFPENTTSFDASAAGVWSAGVNQSNTKQLGYVNVANVATNSGGAISGTVYSYKDPDGIQRRGKGAYWTGNSFEGQPMANYFDPGTGSARADVMRNRPIILNRPFRSVAELGYVFRDTPWRNLDFFTVESGDAALLDFFCIFDTAENEAAGRSAVPLTREGAPIVAGKVNLNTTHPEVLAALIRGTGLENQSGGTALIDAGQALDIGEVIVNFTSSSAPNQGPFESLADLVGRWSVNGTTYEGLSDELGGVLTSNADRAVKQRREAVLRGLVDAGGVRTWNVLIDVIAQSGTVTSDGSPVRFIPHGERRIWASTAIDRFTTEVIGKHWEIVHE